MIAQLWKIHAVQAFIGKRQQEHMPCRCFSQTARTQVEQRIIIKLADRRAVRTLHVIGVNFKLRFGIDLRVVRKQQVAVGLLGVSLLRVFVNDDAPMKHTVRLAIQNAVVKLAAIAMRTGMLHQHVVIHVLATVSHKKAIDQAFASLTREHRMYVVAHQRSAQEQRVRSHIRVASLLDAQSRKVVSLIAFTNDHVVRHMSVVSSDQLRGGVGKRNALT